MFWVDTKRIIKAGYTNFRRNGVISLAAVLVMTITLSVITSLILLQAVLNFSLAEIKDKVDVTIYFNTDAPADNILELKSALEKLPEVSAVSYVSADEALEKFKARHESDYLTLQALEELEGNPLGASLNVKAKETSQYEAIAKFLDGNSPAVKSATTAISKVNYHQNKVIIDRLTSLIDGAKRLGLLVTIILVLISIVITFNTIRLTIFIAREEIGIMRLVGAGSQYIRGPFMMEGAIYGVVSTLLTMVIFLPISYWLGKNMTAFFGMNMFDYFLANFLQIFAINLVAGVLLGIISSSFAIRKYLYR